MVMISSFISNLYRNFRLFTTDAGNNSFGGGLALEGSPVLSACILGDPASAVENNVNARNQNVKYHLIKQSTRQFMQMAARRVS
jgi:hypothetical protein